MEVDSHVDLMHQAHWSTESGRASRIVHTSPYDAVLMCHCCDVIRPNGLKWPQVSNLVFCSNNPNLDDDARLM